MVKKDKFIKFYIFYLWILFIILISVLYIGINSISNLNAQEHNEYKELLEENQRLKLEIENLKNDKFEATFKSCSKFCRRL